MGSNISCIRSADATLCENNRVKVSWEHDPWFTKAYKIDVIKNDGASEVVDASGKKFHYIKCDPAAKYVFSVHFGNKTSVQTRTIYTAPSRIVHLNVKEEETSVLVSWEPLRDEEVYYCLAVICKGQTIDEVNDKVDCFYKLNFINSGSYEFKVWAVSKHGERKGNPKVQKLNIDTEIKDVKAELENDKAIVTWKYFFKKNFVVQIKQDGKKLSEEVVLEKKLEYFFHPSHKYDFGVKVEDMPESDFIWSNSLYAAPSRIANLTPRETETSFVISWPILENEDVCYCVCVQYNHTVFDEVRNKGDCSYQLDFNKCQAGSYEFKVWAVSRHGRKNGEACVLKQDIGSKVTNVKAALEGNKAIVTWKYPLKKKFIVQVNEDGCKLGKHNVSERKFQWPCRPSRNYDFIVWVEKAVDSYFVLSNSVCAAPSRIRHLDIAEKTDGLLRISWPENTDESVSYNFVVLRDSEKILEEQKKDVCYFEHNLDQKTRQAGKCEVKVWAVSNQGGTMSKPVIRDLNTDVFDLEAKVESGKVIVTWKCFLRNIFEYKVVKNGRSMNQVHVISQKKIELRCEPACKYEFLVRIKENINNDADYVRSEPIYTVPTKVVNLSLKEKETSVLVSWKPPRGEKVYYRVAVYCGDEKIDEVCDKENCSYELDFNNLAAQSGSYELRVWAVSKNGGQEGKAAVRKLATKVTDLKAVLENSKAIVTWKYLLKKKFIVQTRENETKVDEQIVSERKFEWPCRPARNYDFCVRLENTPDSESVFSNSVCTVPSKVGNLTLKKEDISVLVSWEPLRGEHVYYCVAVYCGGEKIDEVRGKEDCSYELNFNSLASQSDSYEFKVWAVSNNGGQEGKAAVQELNIASSEDKFGNSQHESASVNGEASSIEGRHTTGLPRSNLHEIAVCDEEITFEDIEIMAEKVNRSTAKMPEIEFCDCNLTVNHLQSFLEKMKDVKREIRTCSISHMGSINELIETICSIVEKHRIAELSLVYDYLNDKSIELLQEHLHKKKVDSLKLINVSHNENIGPAGYKQTGEIVRDCNIVSFKANNCQITDEKLKKFFEGLQSGGQFKKLSIGRNTELTPEGFNTLATFVEEHGLESLNLSGCELSQKKLEVFLNTSVCQILKSLDVSYNSTIEDDAPLAKLVANYRVTELSVAGCKLKREHLALFKTQKPYKMNILNMRDNKTIGACMTEIAQLARIFELNELNISDCMLSAIELESFRKSLDGYKLKCLHLGDQDQEPDAGYMEEICKILTNVEDKLYIRFYKLGDVQRSLLKNPSVEIMLTVGSIKECIKNEKRT